jgi:predicted acylesterase/phospholipase RssA
MRFLVLSGGSSKGAYASGCLKYLLGDLKINYSGYCGSSSGAINAGFLAQFPVGQEKMAANQLCNLWSNLDNSKIFQNWKPFGFVHALWKMSLYDSSPFQNLINTHIDLNKIRKSGKTVSVGAVSIHAGKYTNFDQTSDDFIQAIIASASFPAVFQPIKIKDQLWFDGGLKTISPVHTAIDLGASEIDVICTSPEQRNKKFILNPNILDIFKRALDLSTDKIMSNDIEKAVMYNKMALSGLTDKKYIKLNIIRPDFNLIENLLDFDPVKIREMMKLGYEDAKLKYNPLLIK